MSLLVNKNISKNMRETKQKSILFRNYYWNKMFEKLFDITIFENIDYFMEKIEFKLKYQIN